MMNTSTIDMIVGMIASIVIAVIITFIRAKQLNEITENTLESMREEVNHPDHYQGAGIEVIDVIKAFGLDFHTGNAVKYILRHDKKHKDDPEKDLRKAIWYLEDKIREIRKSKVDE